MSVDKLHAALAAALGDLHEPHKSGRADTGQYGYTYLTLGDLSDVVRAAFKPHGLAFTQHPTIHESWVTVTTRLIHSSGATWRTEPLSMPVAKGTPQGIGSVITYCRRYQLAALVGLSGSDDDDAAPETAGQEPRPATQPSPAVAGPTRTTSGGPARPKQGPQRDNPQTDAQRRRLWATARAHGYGAKDELAAFVCGLLDVEYDEERLSHLTKAEASRVIDALQEVEVAERLDSTPADDPWQTKEQAVMAE